MRKARRAVLLDTRRAEVKEANMLAARSRPINRTVQVNRNLQNYPLARDARTNQEWRRSEPNGKRWWSNLSSESRITLRVPRDTRPALRHAPSAFDMNVVFLLIADAQNTKTRALEFPSAVAMLAALGHRGDSRNRRRLENTLDYWRVLTLCHRTWRLAKREGHVKKILPPPIKSFECISRRIK